MNSFLFPEGQIIAVALIFMRMLAFVIAAPILGVQTVPTSLKILLSLILALVLLPIVKYQHVELIKINEEIILMAMREIAIGLILGFLMKSFFFAISVMGEIISLSMGLSSAQIFNPALGIQSNIIEQFETVIATVLFLSMNGHYLFLSGMADSLNVLPVASLSFRYESFVHMAGLAQEIMLIGIKMAAPVMLAVFLTNVSMGVLGRAVPQINILVTSLSVTVMLGMFILFITMPLTVNEMQGLVNEMSDYFFKYMKVL